MASDTSQLERELALRERAVAADRRLLIAMARDTDRQFRDVAQRVGATATAFGISALVGALLVGPRHARRRR